MNHQELSSRLVSLCFILWGILFTSVYADANIMPCHMVNVTAEGAACRLSTDGNDQINDIINYLNSYLTEQENNPPKNRDIENIQLPELQYIYPRIPLSQISVYFKPLDNLCEKISALCQRERDDEPYYYHSDHLGGAAWITDNSGTPVQYLHYAPYGEQLHNQHPYSYRERFTFTGKEKDEETGYYYFGAQNYLPAFSVWGAVDQLADKYIYNSPYAYCSGNPINLFDPDGRIVESAWDLFWVIADAASAIYDFAIGDKQQAKLDVASLAADAAALFVPVVPAVGGATRVASRLGTKTDDVAKAINKSQSVSKTQLSEISKIGPKPNNGLAKPHGGHKHNKELDTRIQMLPKRAENIRKNQIQVDVNGNRVGNNRPDIQYDLDGVHYNVEIDANASRSEMHGSVIRQNDPNANVELIIIEK